MIKNSLPQHVAIIPDGNRRWAKKRGLLPWRGHIKAAQRIEEIAKAAIDLDIKYLTIWGGSYDNLTRRPRREVLALNQVYCQLAQRLLKDPEIYRKQVRVRILGEWPKLLNERVVKLLKQSERETAGHTAYGHSYLIGYNGDREMLDAINRIVKEGSGRVNGKLLKSYLWTTDLPPVDFIIRTGGEPHLSAGFMMWEAQDAQLYFVDKLWPDFDKKSFEEALREYGRRRRRFGR